MLNRIVISTLGQFECDAEASSIDRSEWFWSFFSHIAHSHRVAVTLGLLIWFHMPALPDTHTRIGPRLRPRAEPKPETVASSQLKWMRDGSAKTKHSLFIWIIIVRNGCERARRTDANEPEHIQPDTCTNRFPLLACTASISALTIFYFFWIEIKESPFIWHSNGKSFNFNA